MATDDNKVVDTINKVLKIINKEGLNVPELIAFYGNLGIHIGCGIAGIKEIPTIEEIKREYFTKPTIDLALIQQGYLITSWEEDWIKSPQLSKFAAVKTPSKE
jgi:hypothetical protein